MRTALVALFVASLSLASFLPSAHAAPTRVEIYDYYLHWRGAVTNGAGFLIPSGYFDDVEVTATLDTNRTCNSLEGFVTLALTAPPGLVYDNGVVVFVADCTGTKASVVAAASIWVGPDAPSLIASGGSGIGELHVVLTGVPTHL
ncbi:MAG: hypothetical protein ACYDCK_02260 [Thermoplasmatota archaeon]